MLIIIKNIIGSKQNDMKHNYDKYTLIKDYNTANNSSTHQCPCPMNVPDPILR